MSDSLGDRMKEQYENRTRAFLPRRTYTIIRVDGRAFHSYTRGLDKPFDHDFMAKMDMTALALCREISGAAFAFVQSDEISILTTDFATTQTQAWFDGNIQKIVSISAAIATLTFGAQFDSRAFTIPDPVEVANYFVWRQQDATRNSIQMAASAQFSHNSLHGVDTNQMQERLWQEKGINWNDYPDGCKRGRCAVRKTTFSPVVYTDKRTGEQRSTEAVERHEWAIEAPPVFTKDWAWLLGMIPRYPATEAEPADILDSNEAQTSAFPEEEKRSA